MVSSVILYIMLVATVTTYFETMWRIVTNTQCTSSMKTKHECYVISHDATTTAA